ncbi:hypothetical protein [Cupriavidus campinensis]
MENEIRNNHFLRRDLEKLVRERFGYRLLGKTPTPRQIIELLDMEGVAWRIERRRAKLLFDGRSLKWIEDGKTGKQWAATSGTPGFNTKEYQTHPNKGPLPEGRYLALQGDFQKWEETNMFNRAACVFKYLSIDAGRWPGCTIAWGRRRVGLRPLPGTILHGRSNFTIHGGWFAGSAGCIDLTSSMDAFAKEFMYYAKNMELEVRY